jgi:uncharacterized protein YjiK
MKLKCLNIDNVHHNFNLLQKLLVLNFGFIVLASIFGFCSSQSPEATSYAAISVVGDSLPYDLQNPSLTINLVNEELREISGLSPSDVPGYFLAIADERGEVYLIDGEHGGAVTHRLLFREKGDFEGVEMAGKTVWAVKSDGDLFEIVDWKKKNPKITEYSTALKKSNDVEGLAFDPWRNCLLLACKENPDSLYNRDIWAFQMNTKTLDKTPLYSINPEEINNILPYAENEKRVFFSPSGIAVHPKTKDLYLVSTTLKRLVVLDYISGKIKYVYRLDKKLLPQPEGISFDAAGNLFLASEGKKGQGLLLKFSNKQSN